MLAEKKKEKEEYIGEEATNRGDIETREKDLDAMLKETEDELNN
jgi:hypothetical protein